MLALCERGFELGWQIANVNHQVLNPVPPYFLGNERLEDVRSRLARKRLYIASR